MAYIGEHCGIPWRRGFLTVAAILGVGGLLGAVPESGAHPVNPIARQTVAGTLTVDGRDYDGPSGCLTIRKVPRRIAVENRTDREIRVYLLPGCKGGVTHVVESGRTATPLGASVQTD
ncbi:hypothetical protein [Nocardia acidivorans]|uniref:hypothetical protein n=1 Tax=Nocardia acidivorans TaxID=404580 RepID=UPI000829ECCB|nr:hypothetical protein [Nocardia acidivorans]